MFSFSRPYTPWAEINCWTSSSASICLLLVAKNANHEVRILFQITVILLLCSRCPRRSCHVARPKTPGPFLAWKKRGRLCYNCLLLPRCSSRAALTEPLRAKQQGLFPPSSVRIINQSFLLRCRLMYLTYVRGDSTGLALSG
jgi:hypothetical protein